MCGTFEESRKIKMGEFSTKHYVNPGRLATNYCLLKATWDLLCNSPFGDVFAEFTKQFDEALDQVIEDQGVLVSEETEVAKFLSGLKELIASNPRLIQGKGTRGHGLGAVGDEVFGKIPMCIGKEIEEGLFLLPNETLAELVKVRVFTQKPSVESLTKALHAEGALIPDKDGKHLQVERRLNGVKTRGWLLSPKVISLSPSDGDD